MMRVVPCRGKQYDILRTSFNFYQIVRLPQGEKIEKNEMGGACSAYGEWISLYRVFVGRAEGKIQLGRPRHRWEDNIKMNLQEVECGGYGLDRAGSE